MFVLTAFQAHDAAALAIGISMKLFDISVTTGHALTVDGFAEKASADALLVGKCRSLFQRQGPRSKLNRVRSSLEHVDRPWPFSSGSYREIYCDSAWKRVRHGLSFEGLHYSPVSTSPKHLSVVLY